MIFYLDTSAIAKRYVREPGSVQVRDLFRRRRTVAVSRLAYAELAAAVARLSRVGALDDAARDLILGRLGRDFSALTVVEARRAIVERVPSLVLRNPLRGFDALQLATALTLHEDAGAVDFWTADQRLAAAARAEGLRTTPLP